MKAREVTHNGHQKWRVEFTIEGRRKRRFFDSEKLAKQFIATTKRREMAAGAKVAKALADQSTLAEVGRCMELLRPYGLTLLEACQRTVTALEAAGASKTIGEALEAFLEAKERDGRAPRTLADLRSRLEALQRHFGATAKMGTITTATADQWLVGLSVGAQSRNHYRRAACTFFNWATKRGWAPGNPFEAIEKAKVTRDLPGIFTPKQMATMLAAAATDKIRLWVAVGGYAGLRPAEIERLSWEHIHLAEGVIDLQAVATKSAARRQVAILPTLAPILEQCRQLAGPVVGEGFSWDNDLAKFKKALPFDWPHDGLRHSYGTYHLLAFEDAGKTSLELGHGGSPRMLFQHYRRPGIAKAEARAWFGLDPAEEDAAKGEVAQ